MPGLDPQEFDKIAAVWITVMGILVAAIFGLTGVAVYLALT